MADEYELIKSEFEAVKAKYNSCLADLLGNHVRMFRRRFSDDDWKKLNSLYERAEKILDDYVPRNDDFWFRHAGLGCAIKLYIKDSKNADEIMDKILKKSN
jgi:hypothetical protein